MALFDESKARDPFGYLGMRKTPPNAHTIEGSHPSSFNVGSDANTKRVPGQSDLNADAGNKITRNSLEAFSDNENGYVATKLNASKEKVYRSSVQRSPDNNESKISADIESRAKDPYNPDSSQAEGKKFDIEKQHDKTKYTGPTPPTKDSGALDEAVKGFKEDYDLTLKKLNINRETSILNSVKEKKVLSVLAGDQSSMLSSLATKPSPNMSDSELLKAEQERNYYDELGKKYEDKYSDEKTSLAKKKLPNYSATEQESRIDQYNKQGVTDNNIRSEFSFAEDDLIPMYFHDLVNKKFIPFRSFITDVSESADANWSEVRYLGRADAVQIYSGFTRTLSVGFNVQAFSIEELHPMWQRINHLVGLTKPATYSGDIGGQSSKMNSFIIPPFVKFRLGDMYRNQPVILTNISTNVPDEASWELISNERGADRNYEYLNGTIKRTGVKSAQYPTMVNISVGMTMLEKRAPRTIARHFGDSNVERDNGLDDISIEGGDFNHQLIH